MTLGGQLNSKRVRQFISYQGAHVRFNPVTSAAQVQELLQCGSTRPLEYEVRTPTALLWHEIYIILRKCDKDRDPRESFYGTNQALDPERARATVTVGLNLTRLLDPHYG